MRLLLTTAVLLALVGFTPTTTGAQEAAPAAPETATANITQLDVGGTVACARMSNGLARCWGSDFQGSLGNGPGTVFGRPVTVVAPVGVGALTGVAQVDAGFSHACARLASGQVRCWGDNQIGQLGGADNRSSSDLPITVLAPAGSAPLTDVRSISAGGDHTCALLGNGQVVCWGGNFAGQLGDGSTTTRNRPVVVLAQTGSRPLSGVAQVSAGEAHTCARLVSGAVNCWGEGNHGRRGDGSSADAARPRPVVGIEGEGLLDGATQLSAGRTHTCVRTDTAMALCWGQNGEGQLGHGTFDDGDVPSPVQDAGGDADLGTVAEVQAGDRLTCARLASRRVLCWGLDYFGGLGDGGPVGVPGLSLPVSVLNLPGTAPLANVASLASGPGGTTCARLLNGQARCWGAGGTGLLGNGSSANSSRPVVVARR